MRGEFCTGSGAVLLVLGEFCTDGVRRGCCWESCVVLWRRPCVSWRAIAAPWRCSRASRPGFPCPGRSPCRWWWGFCSIRSWLTVYLRRVAALMMQFGGAAASRGGVVAKVQTHWVKNAEHGLLWVSSGGVGFNVVVLSRRGPGGWAPLLAGLTLQCAAKPHWWHGGRPAHIATHRVNVRVGGAKEATCWA